MDELLAELAEANIKLTRDGALADRSGGVFMPHPDIVFSPCGSGKFAGLEARLAPALSMSGDRQTLGRDYRSSIASRHSIAACFGYIRASRGKNSGLPSSSVSTR